MSSKQAHKLTGAEALDEYFTALLDEEWEFSDTPSIESTPLVAVDSAPISELNEQSQEPLLALQPQTDYESSYTTLGYNEFEVPDLEDVQKLLDKMERTDLAAEPEIVSLIEQNTISINQVEDDVLVAPMQEVEEVQEWAVETQVNPAFEAVVEEPEVYIEQEIDQAVEVESEIETTYSPSVFDDWKSTERSVDFQVLYFDVNGVLFAVPLDELGGIHKTTEMSHLIGRPNWYLGLQTNKDNQYDVVDTAKWVMADKLKDESHKEAYQYIVMLGDSSWGLAASELKGTESLNVRSVRWREQAGKRPWLAGMVKEKMCALIHVEAMITMITAGLDVKSLNI
ncbi:chemotaxis protein CheW [Vibrio sp. DW001]|uniref:chemotaxis protein CheW n=1 Tax=Vibrio sp. DW001 TaxID=2912315 RepID=UPI0023B02FD6|nr:chemotaxis protein CheW [Vibrio sp. DW001]WED25858.1 chemotaxis protein CheW [Vibrio sp. DW001]